MLQGTIFTQSFPCHHGARYGTLLFEQTLKNQPNSLCCMAQGNCDKGEPYNTTFPKKKNPNKYIKRKIKNQFMEQYKT